MDVEIHFIPASVRLIMSRLRRNGKQLIEQRQSQGIERSMEMRLKHKIFFYKGLLIEICETLASICRYLEYDSRRMGNPMRDHMRSHFNELKDYSRELKEEQAKKLGVIKDEQRRSNQSDSGKLLF
jgi:hypothetical protein